MGKEAKAVKNEDIKRFAKQCGVCLWRVADSLGIQDSALSKKLRQELPAEEKEKIFEIIRELAKEAE